MTDNSGEERDDDGGGGGDSILSFGVRSVYDIVNQKIESKTKQVESCEEPESGCDICNQTYVESEHIVECTATSCSRRGCLKCNKDLGDCGKAYCNCPDCEVAQREFCGQTYCWNGRDDRVDLDD